MAMVKGAKHPCNVATLTNMGVGRKKGVKNKFTNLKAAFLGSFVTLGGEEALTAWARQTKHKAQFYAMIAKMLPNRNEVTGLEGGEIKIQLINYKPE